MFEGSRQKSGLFKLGFITNFLSRPLMDGFIFGLAIYIAAKQLYKLFGISKGSGNTFQQLWHVITNLDNTNLPTLAVGLGALVLLFGLPRVSRRIPGLLIFQLGMTLYFANAKLMRDRIRDLVKASQPPPRAVILIPLYSLRRRQPVAPQPDQVLP